MVLSSAIPFLLAYTVFPFAALAAIEGGWYVLLPFWSLVACLDFVFGDNLDNPGTRSPRNALVFHDLLTWMWAPAQFLMYALMFHQFFWSDHLALWEKLMVLFATGRITTLGLSVGHDLNHRRSKWERSLGEWLMSFAALGHYTTEHVYIHHTRVASPGDPVTARKGESVYRFMGRATVGSIIQSWRADRERLHRRGHSMWHRRNPWWRYAAIAMFWLAASWCAAAFSPFAPGGWSGVAVYLGIVFFANVNLRGVDYIEHYGLLRVWSGKGRFEPTRPRHSWNSAKRISSWVMFNVQRHSDHHYKPSRPYPLLQTYGECEAPQLPSNYIAMYCCALIPPLWRRIMHPRLDAWRKRFYPEIEDWSPYESPLFHEYPEKFPIIAEIMAKDARLSEWAHRHPAVLEGRHTPEEAHLSVAGLDLGAEWEEIARRGLVTVFYERELTSGEIEAQLSDQVRGAENVDDAAEAMRPWLEDRCFYLGLHLLRGNLDAQAAAAALARIVEGAVLQLTAAVERELEAEFDDDSMRETSTVLALGSLARGEMTLGGTLSLAVGRRQGSEAAGERIEATYREQLRTQWTGRLLRGLQRLFYNDFPCRFSGGFDEPGRNGRRLELLSQAPTSVGASAGLS